MDRTTSDGKNMISRKRTALLITGAYALFSVQAIKSASHASMGKAHTVMPILMAVISITYAITYVFLAYFFIEIQRGKTNVLEKTMAWASAGVFVTRLIPFLHVAFSGIPSYAVRASYAAAALVVIATIALVMRTIQIFVQNDA